MFKITKSKEYKEVLSSGIKISTPSFSLLHKKFEPDEVKELRLGIIASKRTGNAVKRNKCKRLLRSILEDVFKRSTYLASFKLVLIAKPPLLIRKYELIRREAKFCVHRLNEA